MRTRLLTLKALSRWRKLVKDRAEAEHAAAVREQQTQQALADQAEGRVQAAWRALLPSHVGAPVALDYRQGVQVLGTQLEEAANSQRSQLQHAKAIASVATEARRDATRRLDKTAERCAELAARMRVEAELSQYDRATDARLARLLGSKENS